MNTELAPVIVSRLAELEAVVARGLQTFLEVGAALAEIRDGRLYRETHSTFEAYCKERWQFTATRARQLIDAADLAVQVSTATQVAIPTERHARALAPLAKQAGAEAAGKLLESLGKPTVAGLEVAVRDSIANRIGVMRQGRSKSPLALWRPDPPLNGPDAVNWRQAKLDRGDPVGQLGVPSDEDDEDVRDAVAPVLARLDDLRQGLVDALFDVPLEYDHVAVRLARRGLSHMEYRLACRQWTHGDEGQDRPGCVAVDGPGSATPAHTATPSVSGLTHEEREELGAELVQIENVLWKHAANTVASRRRDDSRLQSRSERVKQTAEADLTDFRDRVHADSTKRIRRVCTLVERLLGGVS